MITEYKAVEYEKKLLPRVVNETIEEKIPVNSTEYIPIQKTEVKKQNKKI